MICSGCIFHIQSSQVLKLKDGKLLYNVYRTRLSHHVSFMLIFSPHMYALTMNLSLGEVVTTGFKLIPVVFGNPRCYHCNWRAMWKSFSTLSLPVADMGANDYAGIYRPRSSLNYYSFCGYVTRMLPANFKREIRIFVTCVVQVIFRARGCFSK